MKAASEKMIVVDLTREKIKIVPMRSDLERDYMGGEGTGTRLVWEMVPAGIHPLEPKNTIVFAAAPLNGTIFPAGPRGTIVFKSPETGTISMTNIGGSWAARLKMAGYALLAVTGSAKKPTYLFIDDDKVEIRDARKLWGKTIPDMQQMIRDELGDGKIEVVGIGPAGENLVRFSNIANNIRFAGKGGSGAVMGAKKLKAIAIRGTGTVHCSDIWWLREISFEIMKAMEQSPPIQMLKSGSSAAFNQAVAELQDFGYKHFQEGGFKNGHKLYIENIKRNVDQEHRACYTCPIGCGVMSKVTKGKFKGTESSGPMAEAYWNWGWKCGITDIGAIIKIAKLCNENGVCVNSASEPIAWVMECQEKNLLSTEETGLRVKWGDGPASVKLVEMIIARKGFGSVLAEGVKKAAEMVGTNTEELAMHVKGMELDGDEWRQNKASALTAATSERGASVVRPWGFPIDMGMLFPEVTGLKEKPDPDKEEGIAAWYKPYKEFTIASNCMGICLYPGLFNIPSPQQTLDAFKAITGKFLSLKDYLKVGERTVCVQRAFNAREGFTRKDDTLPKRILNEPIKGGRYDGRRIRNFDAMLDDYYNESGFDKKTGWPTRAKLKELNLQDVADVLYKKKK
jgi:aldehyde:ferredoxin oxidoreductase